VNFALERLTDSAPKIAAFGDVNAPKRDRRLTLTRIDKRGRLGKRIAELRAIFIAALGEEAELSAMKRLRVEEAAQLKALAEQPRGDFMRDGRGTLDDIVRCERKADQAVRALGLSEAKRKPPSPLAAHFAQPVKAAGA
jgi:hypothetical protein